MGAECAQLSQPCLPQPASLATKFPGWAPPDLLLHLVQIAGYVSQPMVDVSILQRSLAILESMVLNSQSLYQKIAEEITVGQLISHLQV